MSRVVPEAAMAEYLRLYDKCSQRPGVLLPETEDGVVFFNWQYREVLEHDEVLAHSVGGRDVLRAAMDQLSGSVVQESLQDEEVIRLVKSKTVSKVDVDEVFELLTKLATEHRTASGESSTPAELQALFLAGDVNQDGVLSFQEFTRIVHYADPSMKQRAALRLFREALLSPVNNTMADKDDCITPQAFAAVAGQKGLVAKPETVRALLHETLAQEDGPPEPDALNDEVEALLA
eukprot:CAMPEP_0183818670 /NCGR_PEP_ID=MMETSP0803_2-20130417/62636_1 /TAXON_ID=195967 /ORGANISM="Crustomastix stigmata, Strain CCMP3273" /LENGTH=233 /DNA_ID=CAMNT_0026063555 /DNA_START=3 /DNA_END=701 /DNA_ORIENTATION=-